MPGHLGLHIRVVAEIIANVGGVIKLVLTNFSNDQVGTDNLKISCLRRKYVDSFFPTSFNPTERVKKNTIGSKVIGNLNLL